ncbi:hypothetical protein JRQ81_016605, partial [Phrynocephalus forsythii]
EYLILASLRKTLNNQNATMTAYLACFHCCIGGRPQMKKHPQLNRNMIREPMNLVHIAHVGTKEMASSPSIEQIQEQMNSKGGYNNNSTSTQI